jgi:D-glycero-alpha-D-manno-heptose-7-phosphate kinase
LHALHAYNGKYASKAQLCEEACRLEIEILGKPIGKQDQYASGFGGINVIQFNPDESVFVDPVICSRAVREIFEERIRLFYTGMRGDNTQLLGQQRAALENEAEKREVLSRMVGLVEPLQAAFTSGDLDAVGELLHENWMLKRQLTPGISNGRIDELYDAARAAGCGGGKILGAGGGGFLLLYVTGSCRAAVTRVMIEAGLKPFPAKIEMQGSAIVHYG